MGLRMKITGSETVELRETSITNVVFGADIPHDSNARSTDLGSTVLIEGKILAAVGGEAADDTSKMARWSLVPAENSDCYRNVQIDVVNASQVVRQITVPNAFVVDYREDFTDETGTGVFKLLIKQKKDKMASLKFEGGFSGE
ncbi:membrane-associated protease 1 [Lacrimispora sp.]|uniref:membrane-associated protease 1 n=1 Tax=Lacrimispora sp. TaxID=2719234 RepID=UPI0028B2159C|nr:membrane-associated protease 1 [Lacrimispora sp.]